MPIDDIDGKSHKTELKAAEIIQPIIQIQNHATSYLWPWGHTHTHTHTHAPHKSDFKKPGTHWPACVRLV